MATALVFAAFFAAMLACLVTGASIAWALALAAVLFFLLGRSKGIGARELFSMARRDLPKSMIVLRVLAYIGVLTGLWRSGGTIAFFIYYGIRFITPELFVLVAFLLTALLSYALGTSFGVASTAGVVLMALARSGGVSAAVTAGAVMSGIYFGDRGAPTSSCASLVAALTETDLYGNVRRMFKTAALPYALCLVIYTVLSFQNPITRVDETLLTALRENFDVSILVALPALVMLALPLFKVPIRRAMALSALVAFVLSVTLQEMSALEALRAAIAGYRPTDALLTNVLSGGGLWSMRTVFLLIPLAAVCTGLLDGIGVTHWLQEKLRAVRAKVGRLPMMYGLSILAAAILCNQTVVVMLCHQLCGKIYEEDGAPREELAMDIANSAVTIAGLVPWCIACAVPLSMLGVGAEALPYASLLYLIPICYFFTKKRTLTQEKERV